MGLQQLQGAETRESSSWWVTGEELVGSGWWKMLWEILGVSQCQCPDPAQNLGAAPGALPSQVLDLSCGGIAAGGNPTLAPLKRDLSLCIPVAHQVNLDAFRKPFQELSASLSLALTTSNTGEGKTIWFTLRLRHFKTFVFICLEMESTHPSLA